MKRKQKQEWKNDQIYVGLVFCEYPDLEFLTDEAEYVCKWKNIDPVEVKRDPGVVEQVGRAIEENRDREDPANFKMLPDSKVKRVIKEAQPNATVNKYCRYLINSCATDFITAITNQAVHSKSE